MSQFYSIAGCPIYGRRYDSLADVPASWAFATWKVDDLRRVSDGAGVVTAVLDTGGDIEHEQLRGRIRDSRDFTGSRIGFRDQNQHGTHCLGTVGGRSPSIGVANGCTLLNGKVLGDGGGGADSGIAAGIDWAVASGAEVISMSLGGSYSSTIEAACRRAANAGVWCIVAAGNSGNGGVDYPGKLPDVISVAAIDRNFQIAGFSSRGDKLDTSGPGVDIVSAKPGGGYQSMSGTSMATPFVAGELTCVRAGMKKLGMKIPTVYELRAILMTRSVDLGRPGDDTDYGPGFASPLSLSFLLIPDPPAVGG